VLQIQFQAEPAKEISWYLCHNSYVCGIVISHHHRITKDLQSIMKVFIAVPTEEATVSADLVSKELAGKYDILDVTIRSSEAPIDRLLSSSLSPESSNRSILWVFYSGSSPNTYGVVQNESPYPVLEVPALAEPQDIAWTVAKWCSIGNPIVAKRVYQATMERRQARLVDDAQLQTKSFKYSQAMSIVYDRNLQITGDNIGLESKRGKVRDRIDVNDKTIALVTTDRQSGFDRQLALVPFKGAVLNLTSAFWFEQTKHIIPNHIVAIPHPYVTIARKCEPFPIEFVVRYALYTMSYHNVVVDSFVFSCQLFIALSCNLLDFSL
jgi:hypothetical protein